MPTNIDFSLGRNEDGVLGFSLESPTAVGGWAVQYQQSRRPGGYPFVTKYLASGFTGVSGITVTDSGAGRLNVALFASEMSGYDPGVFAYQIVRTNSGFRTVLSEGYRISRD